MRLIDADELEERIYRAAEDSYLEFRDYINMIRNAPTIEPPEPEILTCSAI